MKSRKDFIQGSTLIEILVYVALFSTVLIVIFTILNTEIKLYRIADQQSTVNQSALRSTFRLTRELSESSLQAIALYAPGSAAPGVVFMSPRMVTGTSTGPVQYNGTAGFEGRLSWSSFICYYQAPDPTDSSKYLLKRKVKTNQGSDDTAVIVDTYSPGWFSGNSALGAGQVIAADILATDLYWWDPAVTQQRYGSYMASYDPLVYITITCKRQNVTTLRKKGASYYDEVIYGIDKVYPGNSN